MTDRYLERVALCRIPGRAMTLRKRLAELNREAKAIRAELAKLERLKDAMTDGRAA